MCMLRYSLQSFLHFCRILFQASCPSAHILKYSELLYGASLAHSSPAIDPCRVGTCVLLCPASPSCGAWATPVGFPGDVLCTTQVWEEVWACGTCLSWAIKYWGANKSIVLGTYSLGKMWFFFWNHHKISLQLFVGAVVEDLQGYFSILQSPFGAFLSQQICVATISLTEENLSQRSEKLKKTQVTTTKSKQQFLSCCCFFHLGGWKILVL